MASSSSEQARQQGRCQASEPIKTAPRLCSHTKGLLAAHSPAAHNYGLEHALASSLTWMRSSTRGTATKTEGLSAEMSSVSFFTSPCTAAAAFVLCAGCQQQAVPALASSRTSTQQARELRLLHHWHSLVRPCACSRQEAGCTQVLSASCGCNGQTDNGASTEQQESYTTPMGAA